MTTRVLILLTCLIGAAVAVGHANRSEMPPARSTFAAFPMQIGEWRGYQEPPLDKTITDILGATDYLTRVYSTPSRAAVGVFVGYWDSQRQGDTIHSPQNCLPGAGWEPVSQTIIAIADPRNPSGANIPVNRYVIQKGLDRQLVLYWYQSHGRVVASEYWGKYYLVADAMRLNRTDGSLVRIISPISRDAADAEQHAEKDAIGFTNALMPALAGFLPS